MSVKGAQGRGGRGERKTKNGGGKIKEKEKRQTIFSRVGDPQAQIVLSA